MRKVRALGWIALGCAGVGCSGSTAPRTDVVTSISGVAAFSGVLVHRSVVAYEFPTGATGMSIASGETDDQGAWTVKLGPFSGDALVEVLENDQADHLDLVVSDLTLGEARGGLAVTPVTHLATRYAETLAATQPASASAKQAFALMNAHFGGIDHRTTVPADIGMAQTSLTKEVIAGVVGAGFAEQARRFSAAGNVTVKPEALVETYARDIEDGVFDGKGRFGAILSVAGQALDADSLRLGFGKALTAFLSGPNNGTGLPPEAFKGMIDALENDDSAIFPAGSAASRDMMGPAITKVEFVDSSGSALPSGRPLRGAVRLHVQAQKPIGVAEIHLEAGTTTTTTGVKITTTTAAVGLNSAPAGGDAWFPIATPKLSDGPHALTIVATDVEGNQTRQLVAFVTANAAPIVSLAVVGPAASTVRLRGSVMNGVGAADVAFFVNNTKVKDLPNIQGDFEVVLPGVCTGTTVQVSAVATDAAGNASTPVALTVMCDTRGPSIVLEATSFFQEGDLVLSRGTDGVVHYDSPGATRTVVLSDMTSPWPPLEKYFNRLDVGSDNLPTLNLRIQPSSAPVARVLYRYLMDGAQQRGWTRLAVDATGLAVLPIAYQTMSAELGRRPKNVVHSIEIRAIDAVGNATVRSWAFAMDLKSPPVWLDGCQPAGMWSWSNLGSIFTSGQPMAVAQGMLSYALDLPPNSLAPTDALRVTFGPPSAQVALTGLHTQTFKSTAPMAVSSPPPDSCAMGCFYFSPAARCDNTTFEGCVPPTSTVEGDLASWSAPEPQATSLTVGGQESPGPDGAYTLAPGAAPVVEVLTSPSFTLGGAAYNWSTDVATYAAYVSDEPVQGRYRAPPAFNVLASASCVFPSTSGSGGGGGDGGDELVPNAAGVTCYEYAWLPTLTSLSLAASPWTVSAQHPLLSWVQIGVKTSAACANSVVRTLSEQ